ncbi:hypothetical protein B9Z55_012085 [Caenorhabditis nigoni]|uniref:SCP domain-containing protein n=1 Tax=Caenorhabditis nigoni TaxID=1611254 RepID=A0A2G5TVS4_9PELO|nr:hypothetical protein B9Z55_012085 [Caenorhabditis nigoni]
MPPKHLLAFLLIFGSLVPAYFGDYVSDKIDEAKKEKLWVVNDIRRKWARNLNVANMNELSYNEGLEKKFNVSCEERYKYNQMDNRLGRVRNDWETYEKELGMISGYTTMNCLHPLQTEIACNFKFCPMDPHKPINDVSKKKNAFVCVCGPKTSFSSSDLIKGEAGSKCEGGADHGLCTGVLNSSGVFDFEIFLNLIILYLVVYMF